MKAPDYPDNEKARVQVLAEYGILDTPSEEAFDNLTKLVADLLEVPFALVSLVDAKRQWFKSRYGLDATETSREISFCGHVV
ncbi:MAG: GGDEF domain-containing protein, partial [Planctomycetota bacterium]